ncbi:hypothetical protein BC936DRAFT_139439 [Jimgerdemannia flammicorona]|uniref:Uncharacterized protein n=1 Tax=Jimgerdemannia flammicorona TaxID=994334 RepID=A0A433DHX3_9FUNG|nr:hypothetical protein BC936DRAFT_139439 [Jimgerdemannia flammicorona]
MERRTGKPPIPSSLKHDLPDPRATKTTALALLEQKRAELDAKREKLRNKMTSRTTRPSVPTTLSAAATLTTPTTTTTRSDGTGDEKAAAGASTKRAREAHDSPERESKRTAADTTVKSSGDQAVSVMVSSPKMGAAPSLGATGEPGGKLAVVDNVSVQKGETFPATEKAQSSFGRGMFAHEDSHGNDELWQTKDGLFLDAPLEDGPLTERELNSTFAIGSTGIPTSPDAADAIALDAPRKTLRRSLRLSGQHSSLLLGSTLAHDHGPADEQAVTEDEELVMLEARMMQWCFFNARATHAFERQTEAAQACFFVSQALFIYFWGETLRACCPLNFGVCRSYNPQQQLWTAWRALTKEREALYLAQRKWKVETDILGLEEALATQNDHLTRVGGQLSQFKERYLTFASALATTTTALPTVNIVIGDLDELVNELHECDAVLSKMTEGHDTSSQKLDRYAKSIRGLCGCLQDEVEELRECQRLLNEIAAAETTERSLRLGQVQLREVVHGQG